MAFLEVQPVVTPGKKGGGAFGGALGSILGGIIGAIGAAAAPATAGGSLGLIPAGMAIGGTAGGLAGEAADGSKGADVQGVVGKTENRKPMQTVAAQNPEVKLATLQNSKNLLKTSDVPDAMKYMGLIDEASGKLKNQMGIG